MLFRSQLILIEGHTGTRFLGQHIGQFNEHELVLLAPDTPHTWDSQFNNENVNKVTLVFWQTELFSASAPEFQQLRSWLRSLQSGAVFQCLNRADINALFRQISSSGPVLQLSLLIFLLCKLQNCQFQTITDNEFEYYDSRFNNVLRFIHQNISSGCSLVSCANHAYISPATLKRMFEKYLNTSYSKFIATKRLQLASQLLSCSSYSMQLIAEQSGYGSVRQFNHQFRQHFACTPRQYREEHQWRKRH